MADEWLLTEEDAKEVSEAIQWREHFSIDLVVGGCKMEGSPPSNEIEEKVFNGIRGNSLAHAWLAAAWDFNQLHYVVWVNNIPFAFKSPFGWSFIPRLNYAAGKLPDDFAEHHSLALEVLMQVIR